MLVEFDVDDLDKNQEESFWFELDVSHAQAEAFNKKMKGFCYLIYDDKLPGGKFATGPYMLLWEHFSEEDPSEDLGPFTTETKAKESAKALWNFCNNAGEPKFNKV